MNLNSGWIKTVITAAALLTSVGIAKADEVNLSIYGFKILKCFHPSGTFVAAQFDKERVDDNTPSETNGQIAFKGKITGKLYYMEIVVRIRKIDNELYMRVTPGNDTALLSPDANCYLREWSRIPR